MNLKSTGTLDGSARRGVTWEPRSVVELGANSLKIHTAVARGFHTVKHPYALGHEVYSSGRISEITMNQVVHLLRRSGSRPAIAIGTSAVRDASNGAQLVAWLRRRLGLTLYVLSSWQEAALLAEGYLARSSRLPAIVADIGGGSLEVVYMNRARSVVWDSLPLGAIRFYQMGLARGDAYRTRWVDDVFRQSSVVRAEEVHVTGGTAQAVATVLGKDVFAASEIDALLERVRRDGPPADLKPERARVFLAGLTLLRRFQKYLRESDLRHSPISIGGVFLALAGREFCLRRSERCG